MNRGKAAFSDVKPFASLSSGLLARKGAARPAMRSQSFAPAPASLDDLGWNDMGEGERITCSIAALTPAPGPAEAEAPEPITVSPAREQQQVIAEAFAEAEPVDVMVAAVLEPAPLTVAAGRKSAFTLRLDTDRHLRLRLACAVQHRSAQRVVTAALDAYLDSLPELEEFVRQVPATLAKQD